MPRDRQAQQLRARRRTREALDQARAVLGAQAQAAAPAPGGATAALLAQLQEDAELLGRAGALRISAARRLQGAQSRVRTRTAALFSLCSDVRRRVRDACRGRRNAAVRAAFGEGACPGGGKVPEVLKLAEQILSAAPAHPAELQAARVTPRLLAGLLARREALRQAIADRRAWRDQQEQLAARLAAVASRVLLACTALGPPPAPTPAPPSPTAPESAP